MLIPFFFVSASSALECITIGREFTYHSNFYPKGKGICIESSFPNFLIITNQIKHAKISYKILSEFGDTRDRGVLQKEPFYFFKNLVKIKFNAHMDTNISFSAVSIPDKCVNNTWYSNKPFSSFFISDENSSENSFSLHPNGCVYFSTGPMREFSFDVHLPGGNGKLFVGEQILSGGSILYPSKVCKNKAFIYTVNEKAGNRNITIKSISKEQDIPTVPGSGFIQKETVYRKHIYTVVISYSLSILFFIAVTVIFVKCIDEKEKTKMYEKVITI